MFIINRNNKNILLIGLPEWDELGVPIKYNRYIKAEWTNASELSRSFE